MLVVPDKQLLVINTPLSADILTIIPHAKQFMHKGTQLTAVAHGVEESQVLKNMGFDVPHPIQHYYDWPGRLTPMAHQKETAAFMVSNRRALCLSAPGTGKSLAVLWAADYMLNLGLIKKVLIIAPLSILKPVWGTEFMHHFPHRAFNIILGARAKRESLIAEPGVEFSIINHDGFSTMPWLFKDYDLLIYDEACFVAGTKVTTPQGYKSIEDICVGDIVCTPTGNKKVRATSVHKSNNLVTIDTPVGALTGTADHPFFTGIAMEDMNATKTAVTHMPKLWGRFSSNQEASSHIEILLSLLPLETSVGNAEGVYAITHAIRECAKESSCWVEESVGRRTPTETTERKRKGGNVGESESSWSLPLCTRRKWNWANRVRNFVAEYFTRGFRARVLYKREGCVAFAGLQASVVQNRPSKPYAYGSYRGRWKFARRQASTREGRSKGHSFARVRVDSYPHSQQGCQENVYNLEVEGCPYFYANTLLVHNTALKSPSAQRYKKFMKFMTEFNPRLWMLTGTPISQNPTDAWTLAKLAGSKTVPRSFTQFKDITMQRVTQFRWIPRAGALDVCKAVLQPSIRFSLDECVDLPQTVYLEHRCELTTQQSKAFTVMRNEACLAGANISAANAAVLFQKLIQICCGVVYDSDGARVYFDDSTRLETLYEVLDEIGDKALVYVPLRGVQDRLEKVLADRGMDVATVHGGVSKKNRDLIFDTFQNSDKIQVLLAHPRVAAHGLNLTRASNVIWYAPIYSLEQYEQANARIRRLTTEGKTAVHHICATSFERNLYQRLKAKQRILSNFLALVQGVNE